GRLLQACGAFPGGLRRWRPRAGSGRLPERGERSGLGDLPGRHDQHVPGGIAETVKDADTLFGIELPAISAWAFGPDQAAAIGQPVLSVLGTETVPLFVEGRPLLHSWFPEIQNCTIQGVGHLLHIQRPQPVAQAMAEFLAWNP